MTLVQTRKQFEAMRTAIDAAPIVILDTETSGLYPHLGDRMCGIAARCELMPGTYVEAYFPFRHKPGDDLFSVSENLPADWLSELLRVLNKPDGLLVMHNAKFDLTVLAYEGMDLHMNPFVCTQIMSWLNNESESHRLKDLHDKYIPGSQSKAREGVIKSHVKKEGSYDNVPPAIMEPYACGDVHDTDDIWRYLWQQLDEQNLTPLLAQKFDFARLLFEMEWYGIGADLALCEELSDEAVRQMRRLENEIGFDPLKNAELARRLFLGEPEGLGLPVDSLTKTPSPDFPQGIPALRLPYLSRFKDRPLVSNVMEYKGLVKANSTWFRGYQEHAGKSRDGRIHTTFNGSAGKGKSKAGIEGKSGTVTGRLTSSSPNVHQIPRQDEEVETELNRQAKRIFTPGKQRWGLFEFDYKQIEVRLGAGYADATLMLDALRAGEDPHAVTASSIGCSRQTAKHATYTILYGGAARTLASTIERLEFQTTGRIITFPINDAAEILNAYFELYPGFRVIQAQCATLMRKRGYVLIWDGRRRHYERWFDPVTRRWVDNTHKAFNSLIQGGAASVIEHTMLSLPLKQKQYAYRLVNQIHDSLWLEVVNDYREEWIDELTWYMEWPSRDPRFKVPFPVDVKLLKLEPFDESLWEEKEYVLPER